MNTITIDLPKTRKKRKKRKVQQGRKRHWSVWVFFTLTTLIILGSFAATVIDIVK